MGYASSACKETKGPLGGAAPSYCEIPSSSREQSLQWLKAWRPESLKLYSMEEETKGVGEHL